MNLAVWVLQTLLFLAGAVALVFLGTFWMLHDELVQPDKTLLPGLGFIACVVFINLMSLVYRMLMSSPALHNEHQQQAIVQEREACNEKS